MWRQRKTYNMIGNFLPKNFKRASRFWHSSEVTFIIMQIIIVHEKKDLVRPEIPESKFALVHFQPVVQGNGSRQICSLKQTQAYTVELNVDRNSLKNVWNNCLRRFSLVHEIHVTIKVGTHDRTSPCDYSLQQFAGTSRIV